MTRRDPRAYLETIIEACQHIGEFIDGVDIERYLSDVQLRSAVERQMEVAAEALLRLAREESVIVDTWATDVRAVAGFRNRLVHEYDAIKDAEVLEIALCDVPVMLHDAKRSVRDLSKRSST